MKVSLLSYTGAGHPDPLYAAKLLAFTKNTRLNMTPDSFASFMAKTKDEIFEELRAMAITIPSSWEFVDLIFLITAASRATMQQITRTRNASFAMQSQRVTDLRDVTWTPVGRDRPEMEANDKIIDKMVKHYKESIDDGLPLEDARDMLPIGVHSNILAKYNLRGWIELVRKRSSLRVQGSYRDIIEQMVKETKRELPWVEIFLADPRDQAFKLLEEAAREVAPQGAMSSGPANKIAKAIDLLRTS
jgi:flavin-dependent thymidylate synthase